ncbi:MAG: hypothetical protein AB1353_05445 [Aquificota bacterium]|jgi:succinylglutamate desuccinylase|uniref:Flagellar protein FliT n=1 Tax=Hydrogenobacter sp. TaxID=2152829 RepID=A0A7C2ZKG5_9AQUI|nr:hypothetical protein [Aquificaceae bacterium]MDM7267268.1 hypothetical protein [Aquificaceae bacterium]QWK12951.1 MAG: hypothetical protein KNN14_08945 [Aquificota bacterium]HAV39676.1 hypothetical protein [Aquificaceae bacterium]HCO38795.1 hypothetical protein [Aquificaceae bacterium]
MENLKKLLLQCEVYLQQGDWDKLIEVLNGVTQEHIESLDLETAQECYRILEHLIKESQQIRNKMAESLINFKKFKEGYSF